MSKRTLNWISAGLWLISMSWPHHYNGSHSPSYNDGQSAILKGASGSWEGSEEGVPLFPFPFYRRRGSMVRDRFGNEICSQILSGDTSITVDSEEIKVVHSEIWSSLAHWLSNRLVGWKDHIRKPTLFLNVWKQLLVWYCCTDFTWSAWQSVTVHLFVKIAERLKHQWFWLTWMFGN